MHPHVVMTLVIASLLHLASVIARLEPGQCSPMGYVKGAIYLKCTKTFGNMTEVRCSGISMDNCIANVDGTLQAKKE